MNVIGLHGFAHSGKDTAGSHFIDNYGYTRFAFGDTLKEHAYLLDVRLGGTVTLSMLLKQLDWDWDAALAHRVHGPELVRTLAVYRDRLVRDVFGQHGRTVEELREDLLTLDPFLDGPTSVATLLDSVGGDWEQAKYHRFHGPEVRRHLQQYGTEVARVNFGSNIWVQLMDRKVAASGARNVVVTDVRFDEEAAWVVANGGTVLEVTRPGIGPVNGHKSESGIDRSYVTATVANDGTIAELGQKLDAAIMTPVLAAAA